jgi:hypothetical protein
VSKLKGTPADLIVAILSAILYEVLDLDPENFRPCDKGYFDMNSQPDWARAIISGVPFLGDLFDLIGDKLCIKGGCAPGLEAGSGIGAGFCYEPCAPGFKSDGANVCYKQYPEFEKNALGTTLTSITKLILMDTGTVPNTCTAGEDRVGELCYEKAPAGYVNKAGTIWQECPPDYTDTGVRCEKLKDVGAGKLKTCPPGWSDDGLTCREPLHWDDHCVDWGLYYTGCYRGGTVLGKAASSLGCPAGQDEVDGLCYDKCPKGMSRVPLMPYVCSSSYTKDSKVLPPRPSKCPADKENIGGLCYTKSIPAGYVRKLLGTLDQVCPAGSTDFGVGCTRESKWRDTKGIPLDVRFKDRT